MYALILLNCKYIQLPQSDFVTIFIKNSRQNLIWIYSCNIIPTIKIVDFFNSEFNLPDIMCMGKCINYFTFDSFSFSHILERNK